MMARAPITRVARLTRVRSLEGQTLSFITQDIASRKSARGNTTWLDKAHVPDFEGESAWFLLERVQAIPWPYWRALHPVDPPATPGARGGADPCP